MNSSTKKNETTVDAATDLKELMAEKVLMSDIDVQQKSAHLWKSAHQFLLIFRKSAHLMVLIDEQKQMSNSNYCACQGLVMVEEHDEKMM